MRRGDANGVFGRGTRAGSPPTYNSLASIVPSFAKTLNLITAGIPGGVY